MAQASEQQQTPKDELSSYLGHRLRATLSDGRLITGTFHCVDKLRNLILHDAYEQAPSEDDASGAATHLAPERRLGMIVVPGKHLVKCEIDKTMLNFKKK